MAEDAGRLLVRIEATQAKFEKQMAAIARSGATSAKAVETSFKKANDNIAGSAGGINKASQAAGQLSFQLNDIATSLAGGASPFQVMMQQGSQVTQVMAGIKAQGGSMGKVVTEAFLSMVNPMSMVANALILAAGFAVQYFTSVDDGSKKANDEIKKHTDAIAKLVEKYGDLDPAMKRMVETVLSIREGRAAIRETTDEIEALKKEASDIVSAGLKFDVEGIDLNTTQQHTILQQWEAIADAIAAGNDGIGETTELMEYLSKIPVNRGGPILVAQAKELLPLLQDEAKLREFLVRLKDKMSRSPALQQDLKLQKQLNDALKEMQEIARAQTTDAEKLLKVYQEALTAAQGLSDAGARAQAVRGATEEYVAGTERISENALDKEIRDYVKGRISGMIEQESGGNANAKNPNSTATGAGQFIESTWLQMFKKYYPAMAKGQTDAAILAFRTNAEYSKRLTEEYAVENIKQMKAAGAVIVDGATYLAHFLGAGDAAKVLKADPNASSRSIGITPASISANASVFNKHPTAGSLINWASNVESGGAKKQADEAERLAEKTTSYNDKLRDLITTQEQKLALDEKILAINRDSSLSEDAKAIAIAKATAEAAKAAEVERLVTEARREGIEVNAQLMAQFEQTAQATVDMAMKSKQAAIEQKNISEQTKQQADTMKQWNQAAQTAVSGLVNDLRNGVDAGEAFSNMLNRILDSIIQISLQQMFNPAGGGGLLGQLFGVAHSGGVVGHTAFSKRRVSPAVFAGAPRYHSGGVAGLRPDEVPAILQRGEIVLPKTAKATGGNSTHRIVLQDDSGRMAEIADQRIRTASGDIIQISTQTSMKAVRNNFSKMAIDSERRQR